MEKEEKKWYQSKTKVGALLVGIGPILVTIGGLLSGTLDFTTAVLNLSVQIGAVLAVFGIRDLPIINK